MGKSFQWLEALNELERKVIAGQHVEARSALDALDILKVPREFAANLAELARRCGSPLQSLKILGKYVFPKNELATSPTAHEKFIYATALSDLGAVQEALRIFASVDAKLEPEVSLRKALAYFRIWDYKAATPHLHHFLMADELPPYRRLIGKVNLAAALIVDARYQEGDQILKELETECESKGYSLLLGNIYEMQGQVAFFQQQFDSGIELLQKSFELLEHQGGEFLLYTEKWKLLCNAFRNRDQNSLEAVQNFKNTAIDMNHWETVRECDLFEAILTQNDELFRKVISGTPFEYYRHRARRLFGKSISSQGHYFLQLGDRRAEKKVSFSPYQLQNNKESLHSKPQLLALFEALTLDYYRPHHIGLLFQGIYKGEAFNPFSSPGRVLSLMKRLNQWFSLQEVPLCVRMKKSEFVLEALPEVHVEVLIQRARPLTKQTGHLKIIRTYFSSKTFSAQALAEKMRISKASAQSLLSQAISDGAVVKIGSGRGTTYALTSKNRKKLAA